MINPDVADFYWKMVMGMLIMMLAFICFNEFYLQPKIRQDMQDAICSYNFMNCPERLKVNEPPPQPEIDNEDIYRELQELRTALNISD